MFACRHPMSVYFDPSCIHHTNCFKRGSLASDPRGKFLAWMIKFCSLYSCSLEWEIRGILKEVRRTFIM